MRWPIALGILCTAPAMGGCGAIVGGVIGGSTPKWSGPPDVQPAAGDDVRVETPQGQERGTFVGVEDGSEDCHCDTGIVIETPTGKQRIPVPNVSKVDVKVGTYLGEGITAGLVVDFIATIAFNAAFPPKGFLGLPIIL